MDKMATLAASPLFDLLQTPELEFVAELSKPKHVPAGQSVFEEGDSGDSVYIIGSGTCEVSRRDVTGQQKLIASLGPRQFFGEMSVVDKGARSATVRAKTDTELLQLTAENLVTLRKQHRDAFTFIMINIARALSGRLREANTKLAARL